MFDVEEFYNQCRTGKKIDCSEVLAYIRKFDVLILRGAARQGQAVGKKLQQEGISVTCYWDMKAEQMKSCNGVPVNLPFSTEYDREKTLIIHCIPNHVIMKPLFQEMQNNGYCNILRGDMLYSTIVCDYQLGDLLSAKRCWVNGGECRSVICPKVDGIVKNYSNEIKEGNRIDLTYCCFIINSFCNMSCRDCVQYIPNYPAKARGNVPFEIISRDIDLFFDMVDSVGTVSVMGGETFLHPDIAKIAKKFSEKKNWGFVSFPTNGLTPIKPEQLEGITDPRIIIAFGYYLHRATEQQKEIYYKNVELVKEYGIAYTESVQLPTWVNPGPLFKMNYSEDCLIQKKAACTMPPRNLQVKNGKVHTCDKGVAVYNMGIADYPTDYVDLTETISRGEMREKFREFVNRPYYETCRHCSGNGENVDSAIQGRKEVY